MNRVFIYMFVYSCVHTPVSLAWWMRCRPPKQDGKQLRNDTQAWSNCHVHLCAYQHRNKHATHNHPPNFHGPQQERVPRRSVIVSGMGCGTISILWTSNLFFDFKNEQTSHGEEIYPASLSCFTDFLDSIRGLHGVYNSVANGRWPSRPSHPPSFLTTMAEVCLGLVPASEITVG